MPALVLIVMSAVLLPPVNILFSEKMNFELSKGIKIAVIIVGLIILTVTMDTESTSTPMDNSQTDISSNQVNTQTNTQNEDAIKEPETPKETIYSMNQDIEVDYITYKITKAETFTEMGTSMFKKDTEGKFIKVYLKLTNNAQETKDIFSPRFKIEDSKGRKYDRLSDDMMYIVDYLEFGKQLQPGLTTS